MKSIEENGTWAELVEYIAIDHSELSKKKVATDIISISEKSYFDIRNGKIPKENLSKKLKGCVRKRYKADLKVVSGDNIIIKK